MFTYILGNYTLLSYSTLSIFLVEIAQNIYLFIFSFFAAECFQKDVENLVLLRGTATITINAFNAFVLSVLFELLRRKIELPQFFSKTSSLMTRIP